MRDVNLELNLSQTFSNQFASIISILLFVDERVGSLLFYLQNHTRFILRLWVAFYGAVTEVDHQSGAICHSPPQISSTLLSICGRVMTRFVEARGNVTWIEEGKKNINHSIDLRISRFI